MRSIGGFVFGAILLMSVQQPVIAQYSTTASRVRDLESRFDQLLALQEGFLPTVERMNDRLGNVERRLESLPTTSPNTEAIRDVADLQQRVGRLEKWFQSTQQRQTWGPEELAWGRSEFHILSARVNGLESRVRQLAEKSSYDERPRNNAAPMATRSGPNVFTSAEPGASGVARLPLSAFEQSEGVVTIRVIVEVRVDSGDGRMKTAYRVVR